MSDINLSKVGGAMLVQDAMFAVPDQPTDENIRAYWLSQARVAINALADVDAIAKVVADAQNVPFVESKQRKIATSVVAWMKDQVPTTETTREGSS